MRTDLHMSRFLVAAALAAVVSAVPACSDNAREETREAADAVAADTKAAADKAADSTRDAAANAASATRDAAGRVADATKDAAHRVADGTSSIADKTADKTREVAGDIADATRRGAADAEKVGSDAWITAKVKTKIIGESALRGSDINVDTANHVVTLKGVVPSASGKSRAEAIARGTEGVTRVVNELVVKVGQ